MVPAILLGALSGIVGFLPLIGALYLTKRAASPAISGSMILLVVGLIVSFALIFVAALLCIMFDRGNALAFVLSEVIALSVFAIVFGVVRILRK